MAERQQAVQQGSYAKAERIFLVAVHNAEELAWKSAAWRSASHNWRRAMMAS